MNTNPEQRQTQGGISELEQAKLVQWEWDDSYDMMHNKREFYVYINAEEEKHACALAWLEDFGHDD